MWTLCAMVQVSMDPDQHIVITMLHMIITPQLTIE